MAEQPRRRWLYIAAAAGALAFAVYSALWRIAAAEMKDAVHEWAADQRATGVDVSYGAVTAGGFPFFLRVTIEAPAIAAPGVWRWRGETLRFDARPYDFSRLGFSPGGEQILWSADYGEWRGAANDVYLSFADDRKRGWTFALRIVEGTAIRSGDGARLSVSSFDYALAPNAADFATLDLMLETKGFDAAVADKTLALARLQMELSLSQVSWLVPPQPAAQWRAAGGALAVRTFRAETEGGALSAKGTIRLDENLQPSGLLHAELTNPPALAPLLAGSGALSAEEAETAAANLTLMAIAGGGKIAAPIDLKDGAASIGGVKLVELPQIKDSSVQP